MRTSARARLAKMPPLAMPLTTCWTNSCTCVITQIGTADGLGASELRAGAMHRDSADLEHVRLGRDLEREAGVLLDEQHSNVVGLVDGANDLEEGAHHNRREAKRRFIEQHQARLHQQRPADRKHLLLSAGERACGELAALAQHRKIFEHAVVILSNASPILARVLTQSQVFVDRQLGQDAPAFGDVRDAAPDDVLGGLMPETLAGEAYLSQPGNSPGDGAESCRLARAVGAEEGDDAAIRHGKRYAIKDRRRHVAAPDLPDLTTPRPATLHTPSYTLASTPPSSRHPSPS